MKIMRTFSRLLALLLLAIVIFALPLSLFMRNLGGLLFDPDRIKGFLRENVFETELVTNLASQAVRDLLIGGSESDDPSSVLLQKGLEALDENAWAELTAIVAPPHLLAETTEVVVDAYAEWLKSDSALPEIRLDLAPWKENIASNPDQLLLVVLAALPECTDEELEGLAPDSLADENGAIGQMPACRPPEPIYSTLLENADSLVNRFLEVAPDELDLSSLDTGRVDQLLLLKENLNRARLVLNWAWLFVLGLGAFAVVLASRRLPGMLKWAGWPLLFAGIITLALSQGLGIFSEAMLMRLFSAMFVGSPLVLSTMLSVLTGGVVQAMSSPLAGQGGVLLALGLAALIFKRVLPYLQQRAKR